MVTKGMSEIMDSKGFNLRERMNVYAGTAIGLLGPTVAMRGLLWKEGLRSESALGEVAAWAISGMAAIPFTIYPICTFAGGIALGYTEAVRLQRQRIRKEDSIEDNKLYEDVHNPRRSGKTITELLTDPEEHAMVFLTEDISGRHKEPYKGGFAMNCGPVPLGHDPLYSYIEDSLNERHFQIQERSGGSFALEEKAGSGWRRSQTFDKYDRMYLYEGTLDEMIEEVKETLIRKNKKTS